MFTLHPQGRSTLRRSRWWPLQWIAGRYRKHEQSATRREHDEPIRPLAVEYAAYLRNLMPIFSKGIPQFSLGSLSSLEIVFLKPLILIRTKRNDDNENIMTSDLLFSYRSFFIHVSSSVFHFLLWSCTGALYIEEIWKTGAEIKIRSCAEQVLQCW
jgi:hypothetical protein